MRLEGKENRQKKRGVRLVLVGLVCVDTVTFVTKFHVVRTSGDANSIRSSIRQIADARIGT